MTQKHLLCAKVYLKWTQVNQETTPWLDESNWKLFKENMEPLTSEEKQGVHLCPMGLTVCTSEEARSMLEDIYMSYHTTTYLPLSNQRQTGS